MIYQMHFDTFKIAKWKYFSRYCAARRMKNILTIGKESIHITETSRTDIVDVDKNEIDIQSPYSCCVL